MVVQPRAIGERDQSLTDGSRLNEFLKQHLAGTSAAVAEFFSQYLREWLAYVIAGLVHAILLIHVVALGALVFIWMERKVAGRIQDRLGPTRVGGKFGWLQTLADGIKLIAKEDTMPKDADPLLFRAAPYISLTAAFTAYLVLPFANGWQALELSVSVFLVLAIMSCEVFGVILGGYSSGSKWSLFGGMREAAQVVSYEVPMGLCVVVPVMICGTMNLRVIGEMQSGLFTNWLIFHDPFTFCIFWVYFTCATASVNRAPFDLAEAESELVAGFHTEYSGLRWSLFFMAEYGSMFAISMLASILFLGAWNGPIPIFAPFAYESPAEAWHPMGYIANLAGMANLMLKACLCVVLMMWVRWTLPRLRIDQVMKTCLKYCMPLACVFFLGAALWAVALPGRAFFGLLSNSIGSVPVDPAAAARVAEPKSRATEQTVAASSSAEGRGGN